MSDEEGTQLDTPLMFDSERKGDYGTKADKDMNISLQKAASRGLSSAEVSTQRQKFGFNELEETKKSTFRIFLSYFWGPMPWMIEGAVIISGALQDYKDFGFLFFLLVLNGVLAFVEEFKAGNAIEALKSNLAPQARVMRDDVWRVVDARELVPGDLVMLRLGDVVPADCKLISKGTMEVDQSSLTGESLPVTKYADEVVYSGTIVKRGEMHALVEATGSNTFFGKAASLVNSVESHGHFQQVLFKVAKVLIVLATILVTTIFSEQVGKGENVFSTLKLCLVLLVASIPIAMQVVCTGTMAVGARRMAEKQVIVARLSAIEELAGMTVLCSDKTGTLTQNKLTVDKPDIFLDGVDEEELIFLAALACVQEGHLEPIDFALMEKVTEPNKRRLQQCEQLSFMPFDPVVKRTEAKVRDASGGIMRVSKGSPQVIVALDGRTDVVVKVTTSVNEYASRGFRTLGVARTSEDGQWEFVGLIPLFDPPRHDTKETIEKALELGADVKMITGDHIAIAKETARRLGMGVNIFRTEIFEHVDSFEGRQQMPYGDVAEHADGFAEVFPEHKFAIVEFLQNRKHVTGMTGDGVNDAPALKRADIGIAVSGATEAARAASDIVLLADGLSVIIDAIVRSRMIFQRMKNYCIYRIAATVQILFFFFLTIVSLNPSFKLPVFVIVLISILNDGTILTIAYDKVVPSKHPSVWNLPVVCGVAATLGLVGVAGSFVLLYLARDTDFFTERFGLPELTDEQVQALLYLQLSLGGQATVFAARTRDWFFSLRPGYALMASFMIAQTCSTLIAIYPAHIFHPMVGLSAIDCGTHSDQIDCPTRVGNGWAWALVVWVYCAIIFVVQDVTKFFAYWLFDFTEQRLKDMRIDEEMAQKKRRRQIAEREKPHVEDIIKEDLASVSRKSARTSITEQGVILAILQRIDKLEGMVDSIMMQLGSGMSEKEDKED